MVQHKVKPTFEAMHIARKHGWEIILRPDAGQCGWLNFWVDRKTADGVTDRHLISFNVNSRRTDDGPGWRRLDEQWHDVALWFFETVGKKFPYCKHCHDQWRKKGCP